MGEQLTVGSLFSGIGGLDLGLERAGMRVIWQSEIDDYASRVLKKHWPKVPNYGDIKTINWADVPPTDVICGGYPCQPFSVAGERQGEEDERHLWPWVRDAISILRPRYVVLENVRGHLSLGGTTVIRELASIGYDAEWEVISAASQGAPHIRERVFICAYPNGLLSNAKRGRRITGSEKNTLYEGQTDDPKRRVWWKTEPSVPRVANGVPNGVDRIRGLGNAVVPQVAELVGRLVIEHANNEQKQ
jgi:DNA (cytosine-5)-methyltransferase 1